MFGFGKKKQPSAKKPSRAEIIAQAQANARRAREVVGEETIRKVAESFVAEQEKKEQQRRQAALEKARDEIRAMNRDKVVDQLRAMMDEER